jgi:hypothetical protein
MIGTSSLYEACHELFERYPQAVRAANSSATVSLMVLLLRVGSSERFVVLSRDCREAELRYRLRPWRAKGGTDITAAGPSGPDSIVEAITRGVAIPQNEHLFGWKARTQLTALIVFYTRYTRDSPEPTWAVMPLAGSPEKQWPPFAGERLLGQWFWEHYQAGNVVSVNRIVAGNANTLFWANTQAILGSNCFAVTRDIGSPDGYTLRRGRYVYQEALQAGRPVPPLEMLLADTSKVDLAPRFV